MPFLWLGHKTERRVNMIDYACGHPRNSFTFSQRIRRFARAINWNSYSGMTIIAVCSLALIIAMIWALGVIASN